VKKNNERDQEQNKNGKLRRLTLNRETIQALNDRALLELAEGGGNSGTLCIIGCQNQV
jgi:hypothetical protein